MRRLITFIFILSAFPLLGQSVLDSLERELANAPNDSALFRILMTLSKESEFYDHSRSKKYAEEAAEVVKGLNSYRLHGELNFRLGFLENMEGDYAEALKYHQQSIKLYASNKDSAALSRAMMDVGRDYTDLGEYEDGYFYLTQSFKIAKKAHKIPTSGDSLVMAIALHNIGVVFMELGQYDIALSHVVAAEKLSDAIHDIEGPPYNNNELGELYRRKKDYANAEKYLKLSLDQARELKIGVLIPRIQSHLGRLYLDKKEFNKSLIYYDLAMNQKTNIDNLFRFAECNLGKGMVMAQIGKHDEALTFFMRSLEVSKELNARNLSVACYEELATLYEEKNDFQTALRYHKQHDALQDSLYSESTLAKLYQNQIRFETENKDMVIASLSQKQEAQTSEIRRQELVQNVLVILVALTGIILFTVYRSGQRRKRINRLLLEHQEEIKKRSVELEQLNQVKDKFFSIISHDLRSPMNALAGSLDLLDQKRLTPDEFISLTSNLRTQFNHTRTLINNLLNWTLLQMDKLKIQQEKVQLHNKVEESFASLKTLYPKDIELRNEVAPAVTAMADPNIVNLVLRNLILNAIKFTETGGLIRVNACEKGPEVHVAISDNGIGIKPEVKEMLFIKTSGFTTRGTANERGTGIGLMLCKEFIEKNGGKIWFESELGKGTTFHFTLPKAA